MRLINIIIISIFLGLFVVVAFLVFMPPTDDFNLQNTNWNGLSTMSSELGVKQSPGLPALYSKADKSALLIIGPGIPFDSSYSEEIKQFLEQGGLLILMDDFGTGDTLLTNLATPFQIEGSPLIDPVFMYRSQLLPIVEDKWGDKVAMDYASIINGSGYTALASSSKFSYLDLNNNGKPDADEPTGPFTVAALAPYGKGNIIIISDSSIVINSVLSIANNTGFIKNLVLDREIFVDNSHNQPAPFTAAKNEVVLAFSYLYMPEIRYLLIIVLIFLIFRFILVNVSNNQPTDKYEEEILRVAQEHPDWDKNLLWRLQNERKKYTRE